MRAGVCESLDDVLSEAQRQGISVDAFSGDLMLSQANFLTSLSSMVCRFASFYLTRRLVDGCWYRFVRVKDERILVADGEQFEMVILPTDDPSYTVVLLVPKSEVRCEP